MTPLIKTIQAEERKRCSTCHEIKPTREFYRNVSCKDGHDYDCKGCKNLRNRSWAVKNPKKIMENRKRNYLYKKSHKMGNAHNWVMRAVNKGKIKKQGCVICGDKAEAHHHFGYDNPLWVIWLCKKHHAAHHTYVKGLVTTEVTREKEQMINSAGGEEAMKIKIAYEKGRQDGIGMIKDKFLDEVDRLLSHPTEEDK